MGQKTILFIILISVFGQTKGKIHTETIYLQHDGIDRSYELFVPGNYSAAKLASIKIEGGGHTWPGATRNLPKRLVGNTCRDINGCDEIWSFFKSL